jgi:plasmid stabilization system protein ParE
MGAYQVVFTPYASGDLEQIVRYIARNNPMRHGVSGTSWWTAP